MSALTLNRDALRCEQLATEARRLRARADDWRIPDPDAGFWGDDREADRLDAQADALDQVIASIEAQHGHDADPVDLGAILARLDALATSQRDVIRVSDAIERLPMRDADARRWLRARGLVGDLDGRDVVCWPDVVEALRVGPPKPRDAPKPRRKKPNTKKPAPSLPSAGLFRR